MRKEENLMINKNDISFDIDNGLGANGEDELDEITVSYYLDKSDDYGDCYLTIRDETNGEEITTLNDVCNLNGYDGKVNEDIREEIADAVNEYLAELNSNG